MSEHAACLRVEASRCLWHADRITDPATKEHLRSLAAQFILRAVEMESEGLFCDIDCAMCLSFRTMSPGRFGVLYHLASHQVMHKCRLALGADSRIGQSL
jgi:hypothetical protein